MWETKHGCCIKVRKYERSDILIGWKANSSMDNIRAKSRNYMCVWDYVDDMEVAMKISLDFVNNVYFSAECVYYDGKMLSVFCGASSTITTRTMQQTSRLFRKYNNNIQPSMVWDKYRG